MSLQVESNVREARVRLEGRIESPRRRSGGRYLDLQREALRRRRRSQGLLAASLVVLGGLFALFYVVLIR